MVRGRITGDEQLGRSIAGKYELRTVVGGGAFGVVYGAEQLALGRTVAVKMLRPELASDSSTVERFHCEAQAASRLNHPNTVSVIDFGQTDDQHLYLVMEFLRGTTLTRLCTEEELSDQRIVDIVAQVLAGLDEAHHAKVVHADLKGDNVVVERRRHDWELVKVVDFGIARLLEQRVDTERGVCGTPEYMAPEIVQGRPATTASDIYAVGVILYELLAGRPPFCDGTIVKILDAHLFQTPKPPGEIRGRGLNPRLEQAVLRALAKDPAERFPSAMAFREELLASRGESPRKGARFACDYCDYVGATSFKFCPECGQPGPVAEEAPGAVDGASPTMFSRRATSHGDSVLDFDGTDETVVEIRDFVSGRGRAMQVRVAPGAPRARLLRKALRDIDDRPVITVSAPREPTPRPLLVVRRIVEALLGLSGVCSRSALATAVLDAGLNERDLPGIEYVFGFHLFPELAPQARWRELCTATSRLLGRVEPSPILVFDEVERYDRPTVRWIAELGNSDACDRVKAILCVEGEGDLGGVDTRSTGVWGRLRLSDCEDVVAEFEEFKQAFPDAEALYRASGGKVAYVEQLQQLAAEDGGLSTALSLADLICYRYEQLSKSTRSALQMIAVHGGEVRRQDLANLFDGDAELEAALMELSAGRWVAMEGDSVRLGNRHVELVIYDSTPVEVRQSLHWAAYELFEARDPGHQGHHCELAGRDELAQALLEEAGDLAELYLDGGGAAALFSRAQGCARRRLYGDDDDSARIAFVALSVKLADALRATGQFSLARGIVEEARAHSVGAAGLEAQLARALALIARDEGAPDRAAAYAREAIRLAVMSGRVGLIIDSYIDLAAAMVASSQREAALAELEEGLSLVTFGEGADVAGGPATLWVLLHRIAELHATLGAVRQAIEVAKQAVRHAQRVNALRGTAEAEAFLADQLAAVGDMDGALKHQRSAVATMRSLGDRRGTAELLLGGSRLRDTMRRIHPDSVREAQQLAEEIGWADGVRHASGEQPAPAEHS